MSASPYPHHPDTHRLAFFRLCNASLFRARAAAESSRSRLLSFVLRSCPFCGRRDEAAVVLSRRVNLEAVELDREGESLCLSPLPFLDVPCGSPVLPARL
ncbi:hypothetical protein NL676_001447 [Syzygium grande]|nr:hypothetical protein NL676_001447 [Syzygium grande]